METIVDSSEHNQTPPHTHAITRLAHAAGAPKAWMEGRGRAHIVTNVQRNAIIGKNELGTKMNNAIFSLFMLIGAVIAALEFAFGSAIAGSIGVLIILCAIGFDAVIDALKALGKPRR
jgi:hypothetical protein